MSLTQSIGPFAWSPDSKHFAFFTGANQLAVGEPESGVRFTISTPDSASRFSWSPDSLYLSFSVYRQDTMIERLFGFVSIDGPSTLIKEPPTPNHPGFREGQELWSNEHQFVEILADYAHSIWLLNIVNPETGKQQVLNIPSESSINFSTDLKWSPDDSHLAITVGLASVVSRVFLYTPDSPDGEKVGDLAMPELHWSADSKTLIFVQDGDQLSLAAYHVETKQTEIVSPYISMNNGSLNGGYDWFPDKNVLVFQSDHQTLKLLRLASQKVIPLISLDAPYIISGVVKSKSNLAVLSYSNYPPSDARTRLDLIDLDTLAIVRPFPDDTHYITIASGQTDEVPFQVWSVLVNSTGTAIPVPEANLVKTVTIEGYSASGKRVYRFVMAGKYPDIPNVGDALVSHNKRLALLFLRAQYTDTLTIVSATGQIITLPNMGMVSAYEWSPADSKLAIASPELRKVLVFAADGQPLGQIDTVYTSKLAWVQCPANL